MKLYMHPVSTTSRPVRLLIAEKGLPVEEEVVDLMAGAHLREPYASINPNCMVPALVDGDLTLTESSAILKYLGDRFDLPEYPKELKARARVNEALDWFNANLYRDWGYNLCYPQMFPHHKRRSDEAQASTVAWGLKNTAHWLGLLNDHWLAGGKRYLTGERITIADYLGAAILGVSEVVRFDLSAYPNVAAWHARMRELPHWAEIGQAVSGYAEAVKGQAFTVG